MSSLQPVFPRPNVPDMAEQWARMAQTRAQGVRKGLRGVKSTLEGYNRNNAAVTADLARRILKLNDAAGDLEEAAEQLEQALQEVPVAVQKTAFESNFSVPSNWTTRVQNVLQVPAGKTRANVVLVGQARVADNGSSIDPEPGGGTFMWPFPLSTVTSEYGPRTYPYTGFHEGMDFAGGAAAAGSPIPAAADGIVVVSEYGSGWGNHVRLSHNTNDGAKSTLYAHMNATPLVQVGTAVTQGQILGYVGNTGNSFGAHLHFETWNGVVYGSHMDPRDFMARYGNSSPTIPGTPETSYSRIRTRLAVSGTTSPKNFWPAWDAQGEYGNNIFFARWGRTMDVEPGQNVICQFQFLSLGDLTVPPHADTYAGLTVFGVFS